MQIYNFDENRKIIKEELIFRINSNQEKLKEILEDYKSNFDIQIDNIYGEKKELFEIEDINKDFTYVYNKTLGIKNLNSRLIYVNITNKKFNYNKFTNCDFNRIKFENCTFIGSTFIECNFTNIYFSNCNFEYDYSIISYFKNCVFNNCIFNKSNLKNAIFDETHIIMIKFILSSLKNVIFNKCNIKNIIFTDCDLKSMKTIEANIDALSFEDEYLSKVDENTFIYKFKINNKDDKTYEKISKSYKSISSVFEKNRLFNYAGEYFYLYKCAEQKHLKGVEKIKSYIFYYICGYGERPTFALITSLEIVFIFAILYMFFGLCINERIIHYDLNILFYLSRKIIYLDMIDCFYFSLATFTSVGYGDIFPIGYSILLSCLEMILGVTMMGVWTATLARKITR